MTDRERVAARTSVTAAKAVRTAAKSRPITKLRPSYPKYKTVDHPELERSPYSGMHKDEAKWRRHLKHEDQERELEERKATYLQGRMDRRFKEAMRTKKRNQILREATESLKGRDDHVIKLMNQNERDFARQAQKELQVQYKQRIMEVEREEMYSQRNRLLRERRKRRQSDGLPPDPPSGNSNMHSTPTKLSVRRKAIRSILSEQNPPMVRPARFDQLMKKWKGKELELLRSLREKYGIPAPKPKVETKKPRDTRIKHPPFGSAEGRHKSAYVIEQRRKKLERNYRGFRKFTSPISVPKRVFRKAATPTRSDWNKVNSSSFSRNSKSSSGNKSKSRRTSKRTPIKPKQKVEQKGIESAPEPAKADPEVDSVEQNTVENVANSIDGQTERQKLETDFSEFAVHQKKAQETSRALPVKKSSSTKDITAEIQLARARLEQRKADIEREKRQPRESINIEQLAEEKLAEDAKLEKKDQQPVRQRTRHDIIAERRASLVRKEAEAKALAAAVAPKESDKDDDDDDDEDDAEEEVVSPVKPPNESLAEKKHLEALAAVQAALADAGMEDEDFDGEDETRSESASIDGSTTLERKEDSDGPRPCSNEQNARIIGVWRHKDNATQVISLFKNSKLAFREDVGTKWTKREGSWGSSVTGSIIRLVLSFESVSNGTSATESSTRKEKDDWFFTFEEFLEKWERDTNGEDEDHEVIPPEVPNTSTEDDEDDEGEEEEEEEEEEDDDDEDEEEDEDYEDVLVGVWSKHSENEGNESLQLFEDHTCIHRKDSDDRAVESNGTWSIDIDKSLLILALGKCTSGVQQSNGSVLEKQIDGREWRIEIEDDLYINWDKEDEDDEY